MSYNPQNPNGNTSAANSTPVTLASDTNGPVKLYDGTNVANVVAGDTGFNAQVVASGTKTYTFTTSSSGAQTILANTPCEGYSWVEIVYTSVGSGLALTGGQYSTVSGGTYVTSSTFGTTLAPAGSLGATVNTIYFGPTRGNYFQIAVSALTSGTFAGTVTFRTFAPPLPYVNVTATQSGTYTVVGAAATGVALSGNPVRIGISDGTDAQNLVQPSVANNTSGTGVAATANMVQYQSSAPTVTSGDYYVAQADVAGNTKVYLATKIDPTNDSISIGGGLMPIGTLLNTYEAQITTDTTTTVTSTTAYISCITWLIATASSSGTFTVQDGQGTPIKLVDLGTTGTGQTTPTVLNFQTPIKMTTGIYIVTATSAPTMNVWINYYQ